MARRAKPPEAEGPRPGALHLKAWGPGYLTAMRGSHIEGKTPLPYDFVACETGNTLIELPAEGRFVAWIRLPDDRFLEIARTPGDYPKIHIGISDMQDHEIVEHIKAELAGWFIRNINLDGAESIPVGEGGIIQTT